MDTKDIQELMRLASKLGIAEFELEQEDFRIKIKTMQDAPVQIVREISTTATQQYAPAYAPTPALAPALAPAPTSAQADAPAPAASTDITIKAPMIGTFYRSAGADKEAFVKVGDRIQKGQILCIIEAMKLFNEIESDFDGEIVKIIIDNAAPVEYDQPMFIIKP